MPKEPFLLVSLNDAKDLAQTISNDSCRKILNALADKEMTETELSKILEIPISTVHYNLKALEKAKMVEVEEFHYSKKGREVNHYKLANKFIIIAPKDTYGFKGKLSKQLKNLLPVAAVTLGAAWFINSYNSINVRESGAMMAADSMMKSSEMLIKPELINPVTWFLYGAGFALVLAFLWQMLRKE
jgi:DNA-binding transcriptional ArsR family regulator